MSIPLIIFIAIIINLVIFYFVIKSQNQSSAFDDLIDDSTYNEKSYKNDEINKAKVRDYYFSYMFSESKDHKCEKGTEYFSSLSKAYNESPKTFSLKIVQKLSKKGNAWEALEKGIAKLKTDEELHQYIYSYGKMHKAKLNQAFQILLDNNCLPIDSEIIEIIDYGCGQGIGTIAFIDYLKANSMLNYHIKDVLLIEPSSLALQRACLNIKFSLDSANQFTIVHTINRELDKLDYEFDSEREAIKFHIFSNILDVEGFDLELLYKYIAGTFYGVNYFICISPNIYTEGSNKRTKRLDKFMEYFKKLYNTNIISQRESKIENWTRYERIFKVELDKAIHQI